MLFKVKKPTWTPWVACIIPYFSLTEERTHAEKPGKWWFEASTSGRCQQVQVHHFKLCDGRLHQAAAGPSAFQLTPYQGVIKSCPILNEKFKLSNQAEGRGKKSSDIETQENISFKHQVLPFVWSILQEQILARIWGSKVIKPDDAGSFKQWKAFRFTFWISSWIGWCEGIINKLFLFVGPWQLHEVCPFYRRPPLCEVLPGRGSGWEWHPCLEICRRECCLPALPSKLYSGVSKILGWMEMAGERNKGTACLELFLFLTVPFQTTEKKKQQRVREVRSTQVM